MKKTPLRTPPVWAYVLGAQGLDSRARHMVEHCRRESRQSRSLDLRECLKTSIATFLAITMTYIMRLAKNP